MLIYANLVSGAGKFGSQMENNSRKLMLVLPLTVWSRVLWLGKGEADETIPNIALFFEG